MQFKILVAAFAICVAPGAIAQSKPIYFVVDASRSMMGDNQAEATTLLREEASYLRRRGQPISIAFFGSKSNNPDADSCKEDIVSNSVSPEAPLPDFPELGDPEDKTAIGRALESVLGSTKGQAHVVLITDGAEECGAKFAEIRKQYPDAEIEVLQVGKTPNTALQLLENKPPKANSASSTQTPPITVVLAPTPPEPEANWPERLYWAVLVFLSAMAATFFCLQSAERTKVLQDQLNQLDKKTTDELASIYRPTKKSKKGKEIRKRDHERYRIYWFRDRHHNLWRSYGSWALLLSVVAGAGWLSLAFREVLPLFLPKNFVDAVRHDSWNFLNSNIGSYSFAGTIVSLVGFCAFQWWQSLDAKKQLMIRSGIITTERAEVVQRQYDRARRAIQRSRFTLPTRLNDWLFSFEQVEIPGFDALQAKLKELAAPPFEEASSEKLREIQTFVDIRDPLAFATLLKLEGQLTDDQLDRVTRLLNHARKDQLPEAAEITRQLVEELSVVKHTEGK
jgi:hypothetical protein